MALKNLSRDLHQPRKHYASARLQQGRVLLDSDFNEATRLREEQRRQAALDSVGGNATTDQGFSLGEPWPLDAAPPYQTARLRPGFALTAREVSLGGAARSLFPVTLRAGSVFLGGSRLFLPRSEHIAFQRDYLQMAATDVPAASAGAFRHLYYLHVWEQAVSATEDDELAEPMLRGESPALRVRRMRRVEVFDGVQPSDLSCEQAFDRLIEERYGAAQGHAFDPVTRELGSTGRLQLTFTAGGSADPCAPCEPNVRRYLGRGNLTLRLLLTGPDRFVWSTADARLFRVKVSGLATPESGVQVELLETPGAEDQLPLDNRVVELLPFAALLEGGTLSAAEDHPHAHKVAAEIGAFSRVTGGFDRNTGTFDLEGSAEFAARIGSFVHQWDAQHPDAERLNAHPTASGEAYMYMRLWHFAPDGQVEIVAQNTPGGPALGDTGVVPVLHSPGRAGDYWIAALRGDDPTVVVPHDLRESPTGVPPHGPRRFLAPIGTLWGDASVVTRAADCRPRIRRVTDNSCVTVTVGDGLRSVGDYLSIQAAIDALPNQGGRISVRPGRYAERVRLWGRRNITIEGCGDSSVLETPLSSPTPTLVDVAESEAITITGLALRAAGQRALRARNVVDLNLADLTFESTRVVDGMPLLGADSADGFLIELSRVSMVSLRRSVVRSAQRGAVRIDNGELCELQELEVRGATELGPLAVHPLLQVRHSVLVKVRDCHVTAYGQVGLQVSGTRSQEVEMLECRVDARQHKVGPNVYEARSTVDLGDGVRLGVERCELVMDGTPSDHAVVVIHGEDVSLRSNHVFVQEVPLDPEAAEPVLGAWAFGGIQVRGSSRGVELRDNQIAGGVGHGITLGSLLWRPAGSPVRSPRGAPLLNASMRHGVGRSQVVSDGTHLVLDQNVAQGFVDLDDIEYLPVSEGPIEDLTIAGNRISGMQANGISALTVSGLVALDGHFLELRRALIEGNQIVGNLKRPGRTLANAVTRWPFPAASVGTRLSVQVLPWGGIVLSSASEGIDIRNNLISGNGAEGTELLPINGVFLLLGDAVSITGNRISDNGLPAPRVAVGEPRAALQPGIRSGIGVMLAGTGPARTLDDVSPVLSGRVIPDADGSSLRVVGNTVTVPEGRALHVVATGPVAVTGNFLSSLGYHGADTNQDRFKVGDVVFVQNLGQPWESFGVEDELEWQASSPPAPFPPGQEQGFRDYFAPVKASRFLTNSSPTSPRFFVGEGGRILFSNNQVTYDWVVKRLPTGRSRPPLSFFPVAVLGLDHVSVTGNQFGLRVVLDPDLGTPNPPDTTMPWLQGQVFAQVMALGGLVEVSRNRCSSGLRVARLSLLTYGELANNVSLNQLTHDLAVLLQYHGGSKVLVNSKHNLVLDPQGAPGVTGYFHPVRPSVEQNFLRLLRATGLR
jgi:hypothetical protein